MNDYESLCEVAEITNLSTGTIRRIVEKSQIDEELSQAIDRYHTADHARFDYYSSKTNSREELAAFMAWLRFITSITRARYLFFQCPSGSETEKAAIRKMYELLQN